MFGLLQQQLRMAIKLLARFSGNHTPRTAHEQRGVELAFQGRHMLAESGLRNVHVARCARQTSQIDDADEIAKLFQFDCCLLLLLENPYTDPAGNKRHRTEMDSLPKNGKKQQ